MRSILIYSSSSLLRQTNRPCAKQAFLDGLLPHGQGRVRSSPSCQFLGSDAVPGPIRPRWERAVQPRGVRVARGRPGPVSNAGSTAGTCQEELCAAGSPALCNYFLRAAGEPPALPGTGTSVRAGRHRRSNQARVAWPASPRHSRGLLRHREVAPRFLWSRRAGPT